MTEGNDKGAMSYDELVTGPAPPMTKEMQERGAELRKQPRKSLPGKPLPISEATETVAGVEPSKMLAEFHAVVAHPDTDLLWTRVTLHKEECAELEEALDVLDAAVTDAECQDALMKVARELADVVYVAYGTAHGLGINLDAALAEVHRANMTKAGGPRRADGKALKPPGFRPPDMSLATQDSAQPRPPREGRHG